MEITILGSGCGIPSLSHSAPGVLIRYHGAPFLIDSGCGTLVRLLKAGIHYTALNDIFYTHTHSDHSGDLAPLIQALRTTPGYQRTSPLRLYGPESFADFLRCLSQAYGAWITDPGFPFIIRELKQDLFKVGELQVSTRAMLHSNDAIGYRFDSPDGRAVVYSGDTDYSSEIIELAQSCDVLILECSFGETDKISGHLTPREAAEIAYQSNCQKLVLTHFYPPQDKLFLEIRSVIPQIYLGELIIAHDGLRIFL
ncbi:MAG TPA: MBL fold metallo-hydrolase [bacterium]|nr:MBL fold metallo-hydrolase [bacterium]